MDKSKQSAKFRVDPFLRQRTDRRYQNDERNEIAQLSLVAGGFSLLKRQHDASVLSR